MVVPAASTPTPATSSRTGGSDMGARDFLWLCLFAFVAVCVIGVFIALAMLVRALVPAM